jgi:Vitamin B6 photo-protection and homoeostasis
MSASSTGFPDGPNGSSSNNNNDSLLMPPSHHRIAVVVSTHRNGGQATAYSFANRKEDDGDKKDKPKGLWQRRRRNKRKDSKRPTSSVSSSTSLLGSIIKSTFLPTGYPDQIPSGYLNYVVHSVLQDVSTQLRSVLATQRILRGVGVGQPHATALSALLQFLLRDGCGMAGSLIFTSAFASQFRNDVKRWRLLADLVLDVGMTLEVAALSVPSQYFVPMICAGNVCKAICGVAAGATGGAIALHWASNPRREQQHHVRGPSPSASEHDDADPNHAASTASRSGTGSDISDIQAKFAAQNTVTGSLGLVAAAWFAKSVSDVDSARLWGWYAILTFLHLYGNAKCMRLIHLNYLNTERLRRVAHDFFAKFTSPLGPASTSTSTSAASTTIMPWSSAGGTSSMLFLPNPHQVAEEEPLWFLSPAQLLLSNNRRGLAIRYGVRFDTFVRASRWNEDDLVAALAVDDSYAVAIEKVGSNSSSSSSHRKKKPRNVVVAIMDTASTLQRTKAYFHALLLKRRVGELMSTAGTNSGNSSKNDTDPRLRQIERIVQREMDEGHTWKLFCKECYRAGWDLKRSELRTEGYEVAIQYRRT